VEGFKMAVVKVGGQGSGREPTINNGKTVDTDAWLASHKTEPEGSYYFEVDVNKRVFKLHDGEWFEQ
jgi:hypothetical protein